ncbi:MAG TPA: flavin reductase family protein [Baekduia sp.]|nr:flavin reductase family protein [Baekduia sp.]
MEEPLKHERPAIDEIVARRSALRTCLGRFATGVTVVTFDGPTGRHGFTANSFTSVSLDPPLVLVAVARKAHSHDLMAGLPFTINILRAEQERLARRFAGGDVAEPVWIEGEHAPRLAGNLAHLECLPHAQHDGGDHTLFVGEVVGFDHDEGEALGYFASGFTTVAEPTLGHEYLI